MADTFSFIAGGVSLLLAPDTFLMLIVGAVLGLVAGSLPGLSSSNVSAILLPLTLGMTPHGALVFLGALYVTAQYGGSIPAILFKTPGTTGAGATSLDGYPLAQQGKATYAMGLSLTSSSFAGAFTAIICLIVIMPVARLAFRFGPAEVFLLSLVGIVVIAATSEKNMAKGLWAGAIGMLIATMPADPTLGRPRLTFGIIELFDRIPLVPVLVGLFAYPSLIALVGQKSIVQEGVREKIGSTKQFFEGFKDTFRYKGALLRSAFIGLFVGIIPGPGIDVGAFLAYSQGKIWSKKPETFGKGNPEGVICAEAANNAVASGALVPSMALGIPGAATTAIMLAALTMQGITPGPQLMRQFPGEIYALFLSALVAALLMLPLGFAYTRMIAGASNMNTAYLIPGIFLMCMVGAFATRGFSIDMTIFLVFGILGYIMTENNFPIVPLILGVVMGSIAESNFIIAFRLSQGSFDIFFSNEISFILWAVIISALVMPPLLTRMREKKRKKEET